MEVSFELRFPVAPPVDRILSVNLPGRGFTGVWAHLDFANEPHPSTRLFTTAASHWTTMIYFAGCPGI